MCSADSSSVTVWLSNGWLGLLVELLDAASSVSAASFSRVLKPFPSSILMVMVLTAGAGATVFSHPKGRLAV
jgi:hypothetical protein